MAKRSINEILDDALVLVKPQDGLRAVVALREAREVLRKVAYQYRADLGSRRLLKKWDEHD